MPPYRLGDRYGGIRSWPRRHLGEVWRGLINHKSGEVQVKNVAGYYEGRTAHRRERGPRQ